ncbi:DNA alkylation repair protein [Rhizobium sp. Root274]|uniref:DNA alkylation repair protein n=1 Tax=unclassified Rhizobium TaxID=2613769 RepID=UPI000713F068|nr:MULTISPECIES: DNA alkylation repair protein [unclassified Rhizobium]KQW28751.1 DNA alkylation repair protein [Rhizobium sp. Root1240]KRD28948.1 DNA alkylation repair protein [Rhizobium sp. Root274]
MIGPSSTAAEIVAHLRSMRSEENLAGMARFGIVTDTALGIGNPAIQKLAKTIGKDQPRAHQLWQSGIREARLLAIWTFDPMLLALDEAWRLAADFNSWEIVDAAADLLTQTPYWHHLVEAFATDDRQFVRRAAFAMIAGATVHNKTEPDETFIGWLPLIERYATDPRNFVKKAVNWALRNIGKRSRACHTKALLLAESLARSDDTSARWIGKDAMRELSDPKRIARLK